MFDKSDGICSNKNLNSPSPILKKSKKKSSMFKIIVYRFYASDKCLDIITVDRSRHLDHHFIFYIVDVN